MNQFLIDTNILIYYFTGELPLQELPKIQNLLEEHLKISIITKIEFLGWHKHTPTGLAKAEQLLQPAEVIKLTDRICDRTIKLKQLHNIKLADALIAATCLERNLTLTTRNEDDFTMIANLNIYNPFNK